MCQKMFTLSKPLFLNGNIHSRGKPSSLAAECSLWGTPLYLEGKYSLSKNLFPGHAMFILRKPSTSEENVHFSVNSSLLPRKCSFWGYPLFLDGSCSILRKHFCPGPGNVHSEVTFDSGGRVFILRKPYFWRGMFILRQTFLSQQKHPFLRAMDFLDNTDAVSQKVIQNYQ